jgi:NAD(P)H-dependent flavin oxidoreductase YrpB (nitropropane dioxygenase family)
MNVAAGPELAAAVTNAGGLGVIGGVGYTPKFLRQQVGIARASLNLPVEINLRAWNITTDSITKKGPEGPKCAFRG